MTDPWTAYLDLLDAETSDLAPSNADIVAVLTAEVRKLRHCVEQAATAMTLHATGHSFGEGRPLHSDLLDLRDHYRAALAVPPPEDP